MTQSFQVFVSTRGESVTDVIQLAREVGYNGVEIVLTHLGESVNGFSSMQRSFIRAIHAISPGNTVKTFTTALDDAVRVALALNVSLVVIHPVSPPLDIAEFVRCAQRISAIEAEHRGLVIACEVLSKPRYSIGQWLSDVLQAGVSVVVDTTHVASWGEDPSKLLPILKGRVAHVHVSDYLDCGNDPGREHLWPGDGDGSLDLRGFLQILAMSYPENPPSITLEPGKRFGILSCRAELVRSLVYIRQALMGTTISR